MRLFFTFFLLLVLSLPASVFADSYILNDPGGHTPGKSYTCTVTGMVAEPGLVSITGFAPGSYLDVIDKKSVQMSSNFSESVAVDAVASDEGYLYIVMQSEHTIWQYDLDGCKEKQFYNVQLIALFLGGLTGIGFVIMSAVRWR